MESKVYKSSGQRVLFTTTEEEGFMDNTIEVLNMKDFQPIAKRILVLPQEVKTKYILFTNRDGFYNRKISNDVVSNYKKILNKLEYSQIILVEENKKYKIVDGQHRLSA